MNYLTWDMQFMLGLAAAARYAHAHYRLLTPVSDNHFSYLS